MPSDDAPLPGPLSLHYDRPAWEALTEALPLGNGHLGVLVLGEPARDRWVLNEATLYAGGPYDPTNPEALAALPEVRRRLLAGDYRSATELADAKLMARPITQAPYQPLGHLCVELPGHEVYSEYRRCLDLDRATLRVEYSAGGARFIRELFVSAADQVLVARFTASRANGLSCAFHLASEQRGLHEWQRGPEHWYQQVGFGMRGRNRGACGVKGALIFEFGAALRTNGGRSLPGEARVSVRDAEEVVLIAAAATNYLAFDDLGADPGELVRARLAAAARRSYDVLLDRHLAEHRRRFRRLSIELGPVNSSHELPTDHRLAELGPAKDPALAALYVQYARYLLLACSREDSQPANLQGLWNDKLEPPWGSKCTININTQMNYWPAQPAALWECAEPLYELVMDLARAGQKTARSHYGARGWVAHHNVDLWRATAPVDGARWGLWPLGGAWLCLHLWEAYEYSQDVAQLERFYPLLKGACEFFVDTLIEHPGSGYLVTCPSLSPENEHPMGSTLCAGPTVDNAILRELFASTAQAGLRLGKDPEFCRELLGAVERLPPHCVGKAGQLQEWLEDWDLEAPEPHHRHVSHLFGVFPGCQISVQQTPELAAAAKKSLELRGDAATGWSLAWKVNLWARLGEAERASELLSLLLSPDRTYTNLFDAHPPFQIDGNFGGASGILQMLMQSQVGRLHLLPALPDAWASGALRGARARGGLSVDMEWRRHQLESATLVSSIDQLLDLCVGRQPARTVQLKAGVPHSIRS